MSTAPPLGVIPKWLWIEMVYNKRRGELIDAIIRYREAGKEPLEEWFKELGEATAVILCQGGKKE